MASNGFSNARANRISATVQNDGKEVIKVLKDIGIAANDILDDSAMAGSEILLEIMQENVKVITGDLRDSLKVKKPRKNSSKTKKRSISGVYADSKIAPYAPQVELGHPIKKDGQVVGRAKPLRFMRLAFDMNKDKVGKEVTETIGEAIDNVMR